MVQNSKRGRPKGLPSLTCGRQEGEALGCPTWGFVMKKLLLGAAIVAGLFATGAATAADLPPAPAPSYKAPAIAPVAAYNWTGFYIGANAGWAWGNFDPSTTTVF